MGASLTGFGTGANQSIWLGSDPNQANADFLKRLQSYDPDAKYVSGGVGDNGQERWQLQVDPSKLPQPKNKDPMQGDMPLISSGAKEIGNDFNMDAIVDKSRIYNDPIYGRWTPGNNVPQKDEWQDKLGKLAVMSGAGMILGPALGAAFGGMGGGALGSGLGKFAANTLIGGLMNGGQFNFNPIGLLSSVGGGMLGDLNIPGVGNLGQLQRLYSLYNMGRGIYNGTRG